MACKRLNVCFSKLFVSGGYLHWSGWRLPGLARALDEFARPVKVGKPLPSEVLGMSALDSAMDSEHYSVSVVSQSAITAAFMANQL